MKKLTMFPDYSKSFLWEECEDHFPSCAWIEDEESETICIEFDEESEFYRKQPGRVRWVDTFEYQSDGVKGNFGTIDSDLFNKEELRLAHELRKQLPEDVEFWYGHAFEDEKNRTSPNILIKQCYGTE